MRKRESGGVCHLDVRVSEETDRTKGCKIHFPFLFLSNRRAEVAGGECGAFVNKQREGKMGQ